MKKLLFALLSISVLSTFNACKKSDSAPANNAIVMFVNAATGTSSVSVSANNKAVAAATNLGFTKSSGYQSVTAGSAVNVSFSANGSGLTTPLISGTPALTAGTHYSIFVGGIFTAPSFVITTDNLTPPTGSNVKIRFVNLSSDNLNASCFIGNTKLDSNISYQGFSPFIEISPVTDKVTMLDPIAPTNTAQLLNQSFGPGKIYTVILTGSAAGTGAAQLGLTIIGNN
jgi:hypothetical protein